MQNRVRVILGEIKAFGRLVFMSNLKGLAIACPLGVKLKS